MYKTCYGTGVLCLMSHRKARGRDEDLDESPESVIDNGAGWTRSRNEWILRNRKCIFHPCVLALHHMVL